MVTTQEGYPLREIKQLKVMTLTEKKRANLARNFNLEQKQLVTVYAEMGQIGVEDR